VYRGGGRVDVPRQLGSPEQRRARLRDADEGLACGDTANVQQRAEEEWRQLATRRRRGGEGLVDERGHDRDEEAGDVIQLSSEERCIEHGAKQGCTCKGGWVVCGGRVVCGGWVVLVYVRVNAHVRWVDGACTARKSIGSERRRICVASGSCALALPPKWRSGRRSARAKIGPMIATASNRVSSGGAYQSMPGTRDGEHTEEGPEVVMFDPRLVSEEMGPGVVVFGARVALAWAR
jgi:hypothetical protein